MNNIRSFFLCFVALPTTALLAITGISGPLVWTLNKLDKGGSVKLF